MDLSILFLIFGALARAAEEHSCSVESSEQYGISLNISGNPIQKPPLNISCFSSLVLEEITSIILENVEIQRNEFVEFLGKCKNLVSIELSKIIVNIEQDNFHTRAFLPTLRIYSIDVESNTTLGASDYLSSLILFKLEMNDTQDENTFVPLQKMALFLLTVNVQSSDPSCQTCSVKMDDTQLFITGVKDVELWPLLHKPKFCFQVVKIVNSVINSKFMEFPCATTMEISKNFVSDGNLGDIVRGAPQVTSLEIFAKPPEAIDIVALPVCLKILTIRGISLRWASAGHPVQFLQLSEMKVVAGDLNLELMHAPTLKQLELTSVKIWSNNISSIVNSALNLEQLLLNCHYAKEPCPVVELSLLPPKLQALYLIGVQVTKHGNDFAMDRLVFLTIALSRIDSSVFSNFTNFPALKRIIITSDRVLPAHLLTNVLESPQSQEFTSILFKYPHGMSKAEEREYSELFNQSASLNFTGGKESLFFVKHSTGWRRSLSPVTPNEMDERILSRFSQILRTLKLDPENYYNFLTGFYYGYSICLYSICTIGIIGNLLSIYVFSQKSMRSSTGIILVGLGIADFLYLLTSLVTINEFRLLLEIQRLPSPFNLYFAHPLNKTMNTATVCLTVFINVERFVVVRFPLKAKAFLDPKKAVKATVLTFLFAFIFNVTRWFESVSWGYSASSLYWSTYYPNHFLNYPAYILIYHRILWYSVMYAIPFGMMIGINIVIWIQIRTSIKTRREMVQHNIAKGSKDENSLTRMLLTVVLVFLICNATSALIIWTLIVRHDPDVVETLACFPVILNSSLNFIIYCCTGRRFRKEFLNVFQFLWQRRRSYDNRSANAAKNTSITAL